MSVRHTMDQQEVYNFFVNASLLPSSLCVTCAAPSNVDHDHISSFGDVIDIERFIWDIIPHLKGVIMGFISSDLGLSIPIYGDICSQRKGRMSMASL